MNRLAQGGRIDRDKPINFTFDGQHYIGYQGDTIASALLASGVTLIGRSWKYHRPRGFVGDGAEEPNGLFQIDQGANTIPNVRGTQAEIYEGMKVTSTNAWPSVNFDLMSIFGRFSRFLPAGFYYKTFMWPQRFWMTYEHLIRKASGLGESPILPDPDHYDKTNAHCDVLVVGSGPSGMMAALAAGRSGARVILADEQAEFGGRLLAERAEIDGKPAQDWLAGTLNELRGMENVSLIERGTVFGYHDYNFATICERLTDHLANNAGHESDGKLRERMWRVHAKQVVIAAGAHERPIAFGNNDLPGVMLASAASSYVNRYGIKLGRKAVIMTNNDSAYQAALDLEEVGAAVTLIDTRSNLSGPALKQLNDKNIRVLEGQAIASAKGGKKVSSVTVQKLSQDGKTVTGDAAQIECDLVLTSGGWNPAIHLLAQSGGKVSWNDGKQCFEPNIVVQEQVSVGAANAAFTLPECLAQGAIAGANAAAAAGFDAKAPPVPDTNAVVQSPIKALWHVATGAKPWRGPKQFLDPQNDVGVSDIYLAAREGFQSIEHVKRYTALGFGTDQGKLGNIVGMAILAEALGQDIQSTGTTTFRPNYTPVTFGAIAGADINGTLFDPVRKTAMHGWHQKRGALFENVGQWHRPWYYPNAGESMLDAVNRECLATRNSVGIMDASTLGKIDIVGKDAGEFLNRIYTNAWKKLGIDCARYGFMLGEDGMVMDDGVTIRLEENRYFMHTTTGGAASVMGWMEQWLQTEWPELEVYLTSVTDHWATAAVVGPNSRHVVSKVVDGIDFDKDAFPFMTSRVGRLNGHEVRVNRISFSGELAYEVNINANNGREMWEALMSGGEEFEITPYGTETMHVLRAEKGFIIVGQDTDGSVTADDLGMSWILSKTKDFLGRRSLTREDNVREDRKQLVGLLTSNPDIVLPEGGQIVNHPSEPIPAKMQGHVTSSYYSAFLGHSIAMALIKGGRGRMGETVYIPLADGSVIPAKVTSSVFLDPKGERQHV